MSGSQLLCVLGVQVLEVFSGHAEDAAETFGVIVRERAFVLDEGFEIGNRDPGGGGKLQKRHAVAFDEVALKDLAKRFKRGGGIGHCYSPKDERPTGRREQGSNASWSRAQDFVPALAGIQ